jgi:hypothetical protein
LRDIVRWPRAEDRAKQGPITVGHLEDADQASITRTTADIEPQKRRLDTEDDADAPAFKGQPRFRPTVPREWTVSIAVPTSLITK